MRRFLFLIPALALIASCGGPAKGPDLSMCELVAGPAAEGDTITVALMHPVDPENAPAATSASERQVFRYAYETLINLDCTGAVYPGLAAKWRKKDGGRLWVFTLREGAEFHDGSPVQASHIAESWRQNARHFGADHTAIDSVGAEKPGEVQVFISQKRDDVPRFLAGSPFAIARPAPGWPLGSGPYEMLPEGALGTHVAVPAGATRGPILKFIESGNDARDLLAGGVDVMVTEDPDVIDYADAQGGMHALALPWDRSWVIITRYRVSRLYLEGDYPAEVSRTVLENLARDAIRSDARAYELPLWWQSIDECPELRSWVRKKLPQTNLSTERILYPNTDPVARDMAERIMALEAPGTWIIPGIMASGQAQGVPPGEFVRSLDIGDEAAYVLPLPRNPADPCQAVSILLGRARWLAGLGENLQHALFPLVDTRRHVIVRDGSVGLMLDFYGNVMPTAAMGGGN